jgi:hypothetical protein
MKRLFCDKNETMIVYFAFIFSIISIFYNPIFIIINNTCMLSDFLILDRQTAYMQLERLSL